MRILAMRRNLQTFANTTETLSKAGTRLRTAGITFAALALVVLCAVPAAAAGPQVSIETTKGVILLELDAESAPKSVENFLAYARDGFYEGTIFHRVISDFMVQGGGFTEDMKKKPVGAPIENESKNGLSNARGTIAMARTGDPHSATAQFYINHVDNESLDARGSNWGYAVFGRVIAGMDVVDAIAAAPTDSHRASGRLMRDVPVEPIFITKVTVQ